MYIYAHGYIKYKPRSKENQKDALSFLLGNERTQISFNPFVINQSEANFVLIN